MSKEQANEERIAKCVGYCRFLQNHGAVWRNDENGNQAVGLISAEWVIACLGGLFDGEPNKPYDIKGCTCDACCEERARCGSTGGDLLS